MKNKHFSTIKISVLAFLLFIVSQAYGFTPPPIPEDFFLKAIATAPHNDPFLPNFQQLNSLQKDDSPTVFQRQMSPSFPEDDIQIIARVDDLISDFCQLENGTVALAARNAQVYCSDDNGQTWQNQPVFPGADVISVAAIGKNSLLANVFGGYNSQGYYTLLFRSDDSGHTWYYYNIVPKVVLFQRMKKLSNGKLILLGSVGTSPFCNNILISEDDGETFRAAFETANYSSFGDLVDIGNNTILAAGAVGTKGIYKSINGGDSWLPAYELADAYTIASPRKGVAYAGGAYSCSIISCFDYANEFSRQDFDFSGQFFGMVESGSESAYVGHVSGKIFKTVDDGHTWNAVFQMPYGCICRMLKLKNGDIVGGSSNGIIIKINAQLSLLKVEANPKNIILDQTGSNIGIMQFMAETTDEADVNFELHHPASGMILDLGTKQAIAASGSYFATLNWSEKFPEGQAFSPGSYKIVAKLNDNTKENSFNISFSEGNFTGLGIWSNNSKDLTDNILSKVSIRKCPTCPWEHLLIYKPGYFSTLNISDPVNIVSGNYLWQEEDLILKSRMKLDLARIYNSLDQHNGDFGRGWSCPYLSRLVFQASATVFINSDGSRVKFEKTDEAYIAEEGVELKLQYEPSTEIYSLSHPYGAVWAFNKNGKIIRMSTGCCGLGAFDSVNIDYTADGQITRVTNPAGQWFEFEYGTNAKISKVKDLTGRETAYFYDENNNLVKFIDAIGRETAYSYNAEGFLTEVTQPDAKTTAIEYDLFRVSKLTAPDGAISQFKWDDAAPSLTLTDPSGTDHLYKFTENWRFNGYSVPALAISKTFDSQGKALTGFQNSLGATQTYEYSDGMLSKKTDEMGYEQQIEFDSQLHLPTKVTDSTGREWVYQWCARGNLIAQIDPDGEKTSYTYDKYNNKLTEKDPKNRVTTHTYTDDGNFLLSITDPMGDVTSFTYDLRGNKVSFKTPLGSVTTTEYDALDRETRTIYNDGRWLKTTYATSGFVSGNIESDGTSTTWTHDKSGRTLTETTSDGAITTFEYDQAGKRIKTIDPLGNVSATVYDEIGRVVKSISPDQSFSQNIFDSEGRVVKRIDTCGAETTMVYDAAGKQVATIDALGNRTETGYDIAGRVIAEKDALGRITQSVYDENDRLLKNIYPDGSERSNQYDNDGRTKASIDALGNVTTYEYNQRGQQTKVILPDGAVKQRVYNAMGHEIETIDPLGRVTRILYDELFRPYKTIDPAGGITQRFWNPISGLLIAEKYPDNSITSTTYDLLDRPVVQFNANGEPIEFEYDIAGRQVAQIDSLGRRSISIYDNLGRETMMVYPEGNIINRTYDNAGRMLSLTDGANRTWRWAYDILGRVVRETDPLGNSVALQYNAVGKLTAKTNARNQTTSYFYDVMNRLEMINYPDGAQASFTYDLLGRELSRVGPGGNCIKQYDSVGNLISEKFSTTESPANFKGWAYKYDLAGNRISANGPEGEIFKYYYNNLNQVIKVDFGNCSYVIYDRDPVGRVLRAEKAGVETLYKYDKAGRPLEIKHYRFDRCPRKNLIAARIYEYDKAGNILSMKDESGKATAYTYNNNDWLTNVIYPDSAAVSYSYNGAGDRLHESVALNNSVINQAYEYDAAGRLIKRGNEASTYDSDGNLIKVANDTDATDYIWNSDNRLMRVEKTETDCKHDKKRCGHGYGHLKHGKETVAYEEYSYLPEDWRRITRKTGEYKPQQHNKCISRSDEAQETFVSIYDGADESHEYQLAKNTHNQSNYGKCHNSYSSLNLVKEFISGPYTDDIEYTKTGKTSLAMLKDALGSTIALTGKDGKALARIGYDAWGNLKWPDKDKVAPCKKEDLDSYLNRLENTRSFGLAQHNDWAFGHQFASELSPYLYTGRRYSDLTGQYWNRNRYYAPQIGRFTSKDPIGFNGGGNLYGYAGNNPISSADPMGLYEYAIAVDDFFPNLSGIANKLSKGLSIWMPFQPRVYRSSESSSLNRLMLKMHEEKETGAIRRLIFIAHGYFPMDIQRIITPWSSIPNIGRMYWSSGFTSAQDWVDAAYLINTRFCGQSKNIFSQNSSVYFFVCMLGWQTSFVQNFADNFLPKNSGSFAGAWSSFTYTEFPLKSMSWWTQPYLYFPGSTGAYLFNRGGYLEFYPQR